MFDKQSAVDCCAFVVLFFRLRVDDIKNASCARLTATRTTFDVAGGVNLSEQSFQPV